MDKPAKEENPQEEKELEILAMLQGHKKLVLLEREFQRVEEGLELEQFLKVMLTHLDFDRNDENLKLQVTTRLIDLFKEVDVNDDHHLEWNEFSNHIIELGQKKKDRNVKDIIKNYKPAKVNRENRVQKHDSDIEKIYFINKINSLIVLERDSPKFQVYDYTKGTLLCDVQAHKGSTLAAELVQTDGAYLLATTAVDLTINFWDTQTYNLKKLISTPEIQQVLRNIQWNEDTSYLYSGGNDAIIHVYDMKTFKEKSILTGWNPFLKRDTDQRGHSGPITDIRGIKEQNLLATSALDGNICLWDMVTEKNVNTLGGESAHMKGIVALEWYQPNSCLLSAGLDHDVYVWNTYVEDKIFTMNGHPHPLLGVKWIPGTDQIITADIKGTVKIWDGRTWMCMQTFNVNCDELNAFDVTYPKKRIVLGTKRLSFYDYDEPKDQDLTDEQPCLRVLYNETLFAFVTLHQDSVKIWDARNGELQATHRELSIDELTTCCLDERERKLFVGDLKGRVFTINVKNGTRMMKFDKHPENSIVNDMVYYSYKNTKMLASGSSHKDLLIHDDSSSDPSKSRKYKMTQHTKGINCLAVTAKPFGSQNPDGVVASGSDDSSIIITNVSSYRLEAQLKLSTRLEAMHIVFLTPTEALAVADSGGNVVIIVYTPEKKYKEFLIKQYKTASYTKENKLKVYPVKAMAFCKTKKTLIVGDEFGNIEFWSLELLLDEYESLKKTGQSIYKPSSPETGLNTNITSMNTVNVNSEGFQQMKSNQHGQKGAGFDKKQLSQQKTFATQPNIGLEQPFDKLVDPEIITVKDKRRKAHENGITHIEVIEKYNAIATSSFDCCCYIWSMDPLKMIGKLVLRKDDLWSFKVEDQARIENNIKEAKEMLEEVESKGYEEVFEEKEPDPKIRKENGEEETKSNASSNAKAIEEMKKRERIERIKEKVEKARKITQKIRSWKMGYGDDSLNQIDKEEEDEESQYDILMDLDDFKGSGGMNF